MNKQFQSFLNKNKHQFSIMSLPEFLKFIYVEADGDDDNYFQALMLYNPNYFIPEVLQKTLNNFFTPQTFSEQYGKNLYKYEENLDFDLTKFIDDNLDLTTDEFRAKLNKNLSKHSSHYRSRIEKEMQNPYCRLVFNIDADEYSEFVAYLEECVDSDYSDIENEYNANLGIYVLLYEKYLPFYQMYTKAMLL